MTRRFVLRNRILQRGGELVKEYHSLHLLRPGVSPLQFIPTILLSNSSIAMARIIFFLCIAACALAAPMRMPKRQTGDLDCNLARLKVVSAVATTQSLVSQINTTDLGTASAVAVAQAGLASVNGAIEDILNAVFQNQTAPADSRDQLVQGLNTANSALLLIKDPSANATLVSAARAKILDAGKAGDTVVSECK
ncbi:hypothetical protein C8R46DRAFT_291490 [Mycena filopes]|nr:hypothetical protein C8R46DRAFT_291490 [Mycena filopes]